MPFTTYISELMTALGERYPQFYGRIASEQPEWIIHRDNGKTRRNLAERAFQKALGEEIHCRRVQLGVNECVFESPFPCFNILNEEVIRPDLLVEIDGSYTAIELKYIQGTYPYTRHSNRRPSDAQAFPYDVILDCAKIESLIRFNHDKRAGRAATYGVAIGLTNDDRMWRPDWRHGRWSKDCWWSRNFVLPDHAGAEDLSNRAANDVWTVVPRQLFEIWIACRENIDGAIFVNGRFHVRLHYHWEYRWFDYSSREGTNGLFRYIVIRPCRTDNGKFIPAKSISCYDRLKTLPFESADEKLAALKYRLERVTEIDQMRSSKESRDLLTRLPRSIKKLEQAVADCRRQPAAE